MEGHQLLRIFLSNFWAFLMTAVMLMDQESSSEMWTQEFKWGCTLNTISVDTERVVSHLIPSEVCYRLLVFCSIQLQVVGSAPRCQLLHLISVGCLISFRNKPDPSGVICKFHDVVASMGRGLVPGIRVDTALRGANAECDRGGQVKFDALWSVWDRIISKSIVQVTSCCVNNLIIKKA